MARIIISLPESLLADFDKFVLDNQYNRSECVRHAMRLLIKMEGIQNDKSSQNVQFKTESS